MDPEPSLFIFISVALFSKIFFLRFVILLVLLVSSAFISGTEVAFFSLSQTDLDEALESKNKNQQLVVKLLEKPKKLLATILISNNFINILIVLVFAFIGQELFATIQNSYLRFSIEVGLVTFLILLFGEVLPKVYATRNSMKFALLMVVPINVLNTLLSPLSNILTSLTGIIEKKLGQKKSNFSVEKLSRALELTSDDATTDDEQKILEGIVKFGYTETVQIMKPRIDVFAISDDQTYDNVVAQIVEKGFSRNPIYHENIDEIIGVLYAKDLLPHLNKKDFKWQKLIRKAFFVPENKKLDDLLKEFQEKKIHLAIVVDEYGGTSGIVTLEDIIEEIVGDISDEFDDEDLAYSKIDNNNYIFDAKTSIKDFSKVIDIDVELFDDVKGESETIAGLILEISGKFPKKNEKIKFKNVTFKVEQLDKRRLKQVKITIKNKKKDEN